MQDRKRAKITHSKNSCIADFKSRIEYVKQILLIIPDSIINIIDDYDIYMEGELTTMVTSHNGDIGYMMPISDTHIITSEYNQLIMWNIQTGEIMAKKECCAMYMKFMKPMNDARIFFQISNKSTISIWNPETNDLWTKSITCHKITSIILLPNNLTIMVEKSSGFNRLLLYDLGRHVGPIYYGNILPSDGKNCLIHLERNKFICVCNNHDLLIFDGADSLDSYHVMRTIKLAIRPIDCIFISPSKILMLGIINFVLLDLTKDVNFYPKTLVGFIYFNIPISKSKVCIVSCDNNEGGKIISIWNMKLGIHEFDFIYPESGSRRRSG